MARHNQATLRLVLEVTYNLNGTDVRQLKDNLDFMLEEAFGRGLLTGELPAEVRSWNKAITEVKEADWIGTEAVPDERTKVDQAELGRLIGLAKELGLSETALDDAVQDCAQDETLGGLNATDNENEQDDIIGSSEERASNINSGGIASQIEYLLQHNDAATVEQLIRQNAA
jgi:hypothetical protein